MDGIHLIDPYPLEPLPVLLLHGLGSNGNSWMLQFDDLRNAGFRSLALDIPGFGNSMYDGRGWNFRRLATLLDELVRELNIGPVYIVGLSMGGIVAQQFVLDYPQHVRKLVLVSTFSELRPSSFKQAYYFLQRMLAVHFIGLEVQSKIVSRHVFPKVGQEGLRQLLEEQIASADARAYRAAMRGLGLFSSRGRLKEIKKPTLIVSGTNDTTVDLSQQKMLVDGILGARQIIIPNAGHAVAIDQPKEFNFALLKFLIE